MIPVRRMIPAVLLAIGALHPSPGRAAPTAAAAEPGAAPAEAASIELDLTGLEPIDPGLRAELAKAIHATAAEVVAAHELPAEKIHVRIAWQDQADVDYAIRIHFDAHEWMAASDHPATTGPDASASGLTDVLAAALERALVDWSARYDDGPPPPPIRPGPPPISPIADAPARPLGRLGWAGVGLAIAGAGTLAGGLAAIIVGRTVDPDDASRLRDWRYTGYALIGVGSAAIIAGTVMAVVDSRRRRRGRATTVLVPSPLHRGGGVSIALRF